MKFPIVKFIILFCVFCLFLTNTLFAQTRAYGSNDNGQLGAGTASNTQATPIDINQNQVTGISGGYLFTLFLQADGTVLAVGNNERHQLGDGTIVSRNAPLPVSGIFTAVQVSAGGRQSLALLSDGTVKSWGANDYGQLGDGTTNERPTPVLIGGLTNVIAVSAGFSHSMALKGDGTVWVWGSNDDGRLGNNSQTQSNIPIQVPNLTNIIAISGGEVNSMALKADGTVWVWGDNGQGQIGNNTTDTTVLIPTQATITGVSQIAAGSFQNIALKTDGTVWVWGHNDLGQVGNGSAGNNQLMPVKNTTITNAVDVSTRSGTNYVRLRNGSIYAWGRNYTGEVGNGTTSYPSGVKTPVQSSVGTGNAFFGAGYFFAFAGTGSHITTATGTNQTLRGDSLRVNFSNVTMAGTTSYTAIDPTGAAISGLTVPSGYTIKGNEPAYNLTTTAAFQGNIEVCMSLTGDFDPSIINKLKLLHAEGSALVDRTTSVNLRKRQICATVNSLSSFVVAAGLTPTATYNISGKVTNVDGRGVYLALVVITDQFGNARYAQTNQFGYYRFLNLAADGNFTITVPDKRYSFAPKVISSAQNLTNVDFTGTLR